MAYIFSLKGNQSEIKQDFFPTIQLDGNYSCGMITSKELISYGPFSGSSLSHGSSIRIGIQNKDAILSLSESDLLIQGTIKKVDDGSAVTSALINNGIAHLFEVVSYKMNEQVICTVYNPGVASTLNGFAVLSSDQVKGLSNASWISDGQLDGTKFNLTKDGNFLFTVPLSLLLPFFATYKKVITNARHELSLTRSRTDENAVKSASKLNIDITKIEWRVPTIHLNDVARLHMLDLIKRNVTINVAFRNYDLVTYPTLPTTHKHSWMVKTTNNLNAPRYVIFAMQTDRIDDFKKNNQIFDFNDLSSIRLFLNERQFPQQDVFFQNSTGEIATLYDMYLRFKSSYYNQETTYEHPLFDIENFMAFSPIVCFDCSRQNEIFTTNSVDIRIDFECKKPIPAKTTAYMLLISDSLFELKMQTGDIKRII
ncbi:uncharacterized protein LOC123301397 [Chrysoperla carnea]|uniref:uncharacterized protein LOC123301397 n=1 Tax=Chrysoperla carnea TaxID=189513 RepID=UPI001D082767|nr:uncharacterized protein LOC123301397 [Chrysoperla carnea]